MMNRANIILLGRRWLPAAAAPTTTTTASAAAAAAITTTTEPIQKKPESNGGTLQQAHQRHAKLLSGRLTWRADGQAGVG